MGRYGMQHSFIDAISFINLSIFQEERKTLKPEQKCAFQNLLL